MEITDGRAESKTLPGTTDTVALPANRWLPSKLVFTVRTYTHNPSVCIISTTAPAKGTSLRYNRSDVMTARIS